MRIRFNGKAYTATEELGQALILSNHAVEDPFYDLVLKGAIRAIQGSGLDNVGDAVEAATQVAKAATAALELEVVKCENPAFGHINTLISVGINEDAVRDAALDKYPRDQVDRAFHQLATLRK